MTDTPTNLTRDGANVLTNSALSTFRGCPRKFQLAYEMGLRPARDSISLTMGTYMHAVLEAMLKGATAEDAIVATMQAQAVTHEIGAMNALLFGYEGFWANDTNDRARIVEVLAVEKVFQMPLRNPASGRASRKWQLSGKIDAIVKLANGDVAILEHKSTSEDVAGGSEYWQRLRMDAQINMYLAAAKHLGYDASVVLYDVLKKAGQKPLRATPEANRKYTKDGKLYANQREFDESVEEYQNRVADEVIAEPSNYFARQLIGRLQGDAEGFMLEVWQQAEAVAAARKTGGFYKNTGNCAHFGRCQYFDICANGIEPVDAVASGQFRLIDTTHPELVTCQ